MSLLSRINLVKKLWDSRKFRDAYVYEHVRNGVPFQIRAMRKDRNWSQSELADAAKTSRTVITRIEDPNYGKLTLKTLFAIASAFNVALLVKFVPFSRLVHEYEDVTSAALAAPEVTDTEEKARLEAWASPAAGNRVSIDAIRGMAISKAVTESGVTQQVPARRPFVLAQQSTSRAVVKNEEEDLWQRIALNQ